MSGHTLKITPPERKSPSQSFFSWISSHTYLFIGNVITIASSVIFICSLVYYSIHTEHLLGEFITPSRVQYIIYWVHLVFIIYCIVYLLLVINTNGLEKERVREARGVIFGGDAVGRALTLNKGQRLLREFKVYFILFWISMFALYVAFIIGAHKGQADKEKYVASFAPRGNMVGDVLHMVGTSHDKDPEKNAPVNVTEFRIDVAPVRAEKDASRAGKEKPPPATGRQEEGEEKYVATFSVRKIGEGGSPHDGASSWGTPNG